MPSAPRAASVAKYGSIMVASLLLSRILGLVRDTVMVAQFGIGIDTDAYRIAVQIPDTIFMLIAGGGLSSAFIPVFSGLLHTDREDEAWDVFSVVVTCCAIIATVLIVVAWIFTPQIVHFFQGKKPDTVVEPAILMSRVMLPAQFAFLVGSILLATLYARKSFLAPGLAPNVYNVGIIVGAAVLPGAMGMGIESMAWGALVGALIGNLILPTLAMVKEGSRFRPSVQIHHEGVMRFFKLLLPVILGFSLPSMVNLITQKFAGLYGKDGINTVLSLSNNLMQAPLGIFGQALALAVFPVLSQFVAENRMDLYRDQISKTLRTVLYLGSMSGALMMALAPQIVTSLYGWGKGHTSGELAWTTECLRIYSVAIFAWCMQPVLMRGFFSMHKTLKPVAVGTVMTGVFIILCSIATRSSNDFRWLPWATNVAAIALAIALYFTLEKEVGRLDRRGIGDTLWKSLLSAAAAGAASYACTLLVPVTGPVTALISLVFFGLVGFWVFFFVGKKLGMPETAYLDRALAKVTRRKTPPAS
ncbi:murein biosynthesis integral membrane protein MurJ [bacterium]|nr:MAG: murein biosynthesis integral membrane protein MurJ [bacterium]